MESGAPNERIYRVLIQVPDGARLAEVLAAPGLDFGCRPHPSRSPNGDYAIVAYAAEADVDKLRTRGFRIEVLGDALEEARRAQATVGKGDRFEGGRITPHGLGTKIE